MCMYIQLIAPKILISMTLSFMVGIRILVLIRIRYMDFSYFKTIASAFLAKPPYL